MIITIVGGGHIGSAIARELADRTHISEIRVCDSKSRPLQMLSDEVSDARIKAFQTNAKDRNAVRTIAEGSACIIAATDPAVNPMLADLSIEIGSHFCDLGGNDEVAREVLRFDERARDRGVWIVPNCGLSPGLVETLCLYGIEQFDKASRAHIRVGNVPLYPEEPFNFRLTASAHKIIEDYSHPAHIISSGEMHSVPPLSNIEHIFFREPFGLLEAFCTSGSIVLLAANLCDRIEHLDLKTITWPGHAEQMRFVLGLGFGDNRKIDVQTHLTYRDILVRAMQKTLGGEHEDAVLVRILVAGLQAGAEKSLVLEMIDMYDESARMTAMRRCTGIPTAIVADMLVSGDIEEGGASPPESIVDKKLFVSALKDRGLSVSETWYNGILGISDQTDHVPATA